jgi:hypothetical protein
MQLAGGLRPHTRGNNNNKKQNRGHYPKGEDAQTAQEGHGMQLVGCDRIQEEITRHRTGATTPRETMPKRRRKATQNNGGYSTAFIAAEARRSTCFSPEYLLASVFNSTESSSLASDWPDRRFCQL